MPFRSRKARQRSIDAEPEPKIEIDSWTPYARGRDKYLVAVVQGRNHGQYFHAHLRIKRAGTFYVVSLGGRPPGTPEFGTRDMRKQDEAILSALRVWVKDIPSRIFEAFEMAKPPLRPSMAYYRCPWCDGPHYHGKQEGGARVPHCGQRGFIHQEYRLSSEKGAAEQLWTISRAQDGAFLRDEAEERQIEVLARSGRTCFFPPSFFDE